MRPWTYSSSSSATCTVGAPPWLAAAGGAWRHLWDRGAGAGGFLAAGAGGFHCEWVDRRRTPFPEKNRTCAGLQALEGYNARERRALSLRGGTDAIPVPGWAASTFDNLNQGTTGGRSGCE